MMRQLNGVYAQDNNRCHALTGHTFEARFHSIVVQRSDTSGWLRATSS